MLIGAHRGDRVHYPENTLLALKKAVEAGASFVEFDIQLTRDAVPVMLHDATLSRTGNIDACILDLPLVEAIKQSVGEPLRFGERFQDIRISSLKEVLLAFQGMPQISLFIEIKQESIAHFGVKTIVDKILPLLELAGTTPCVMISDNRSALQAFKRHTIPIGWVIRDLHHPTVDAMIRLMPDWVIINHLRLPDQFALLRPYRWMCYEVNEIALARRLYSRGIDAIETGDPAWINADKVFSDNHSPWEK